MIKKDRNMPFSSATFLYRPSTENQNERDEDRDESEPEPGPSARAEPDSPRLAAVRKRISSSECDRYYITTNILITRTFASSQDCPVFRMTCGKRPLPSSSIGRYKKCTAGKMWTVNVCRSMHELMST